MAVTRHSDAVAPLRSAGPVTIWFGRHGRTASASFRRLVRQPFASLMIILVIAVTLAIPAALNLVIKNFTALSSGWDDALDFSVFLDTGVSESEAETLARLISQRADVDDVGLGLGQHASVVGEPARHAELIRRGLRHGGREIADPHGLRGRQLL